MDELAPIPRQWLEKIRLAWKRKKEEFQDDADESMRFFDGPKDWVYGKGSGIGFSLTGSGDIPKPAVAMSYNKTAELVQIFGPALYHRNPVRQVNPRKHPLLEIGAFGDQMDPMVQEMYQQLVQQVQSGRTVDRSRSALMELYLNYTPAALDLKTESRWAIDEAIIKGMGVLCLSGGTKVYARFGSRHSVIRMKDLARTPNAELWDGDKWVKVTGIRAKPRVGNELKITLRSGEVINCTPDHRWPLADETIKAAAELKVNDVLMLATTPEPENLPCPDRLPDDVGWFVGLFIADGHIPKDKRDVEVCIAGHENEVVRGTRLENFVRSYGGTISWREYPGTKKRDARIGSRILVAMLREYVAGDGAFKKHLTAACWNRSNEFLDQLLQGYLEGDGHYVVEERIWRLGFCRNRELADDIRCLCGRLGKTLSLRLWKSPSTGRVMYVGSLRVGELRKKNGRERQAIIAIEPADWRCDVYYDVSVDSEPHLFALASGVLTHNCTEIYTAPAGNMRLAGSFFKSVNDLMIDPDVNCYKYAKWSAIRYVKPYWEFEREYGLPQGYLKNKATLESISQQSVVNTDKEGDYNRKKGETNDLLVCWKIYSRMGLGDRLTGMNQQMAEALAPYGDNVYLACVEGVPHPLNLPPWLIEQGDDQAIRDAIAWPTPFWVGDKWPWTPISFHWVPGKLWPAGHMKFAMGEVKFLNWAYSFLAEKVCVGSRDFIAIAKSAGEELKKAIQHGPNYSIIEVEALQGDIDKVVKFLQHPEFNKDLYTVIQGVAENLDKRTGLTELMYGQTPQQMRSAQEASVKADQLNIRPDDMANTVEDAMSELALKESFAAYWNLEGKDVEPVMGQLGGQWWEQFVRHADPKEILYQLEYRIEAGSVRKPNRNRDQQNAQQAMTNLFMPFLNYSTTTGDVGPVNALIQFWAKSLDMEAGAFMLKPPPPPMPMMPPVGAAKPNGVPPALAKRAG